VGAIFALGSAGIFLIGIPILRVMFPVAIVLGGGFALVLRFKRHKTPGAPWLLSAIENETEALLRREHDENPGRPAKRFLTVQPPVDLSAATG